MRSSPDNDSFVVDRATHHFLTDVTAEQIPQLVTFPKAGDHAIESHLQLPDFGPLIHVDRVVDATLFDFRHCVDDLMHWIRNRRRHQHHRAESQHDGDERKDQHGQLDWRAV